MALDVVEGHTVYVPVYSHIYDKGGEPHLLETTVSIRNTNPEQPIEITGESVYKPIVEAVMIGQSKNRSISFKSVGRPLAQRVE